MCVFWGQACRGLTSGSILDDVIIGKDNIDHLSDISGADFVNVNLDGVRFEGVKYDSFTEFPSDFDPSSRVGLLKA